MNQFVEPQDDDSENNYVFPLVVGEEWWQFNGEVSQSAGTIPIYPHPQLSATPDKYELVGLIMQKLEWKAHGLIHDKFCQIGMESETWRDHPVLFLHQKEAWTTTKLWMTVASFAKLLNRQICACLHTTLEPSKNDWFTSDPKWANLKSKGPSVAQECPFLNSFWWFQVMLGRTRVHFPDVQLIGVEQIYRRPWLSWFWPKYGGFQIFPSTNSGTNHLSQKKNVNGSSSHAMEKTMSATTSQCSASAKTLMFGNSTCQPSLN